MDWTEKFERLRKGRSIASIEKAANWGHKTLSNALRDKTMPAADRAVRLSKVLGVDPRWLFDENVGMDSLYEFTASAEMSGPAVLSAVKMAVAQALQDAGSLLSESLRRER